MARPISFTVQEADVSRLAELRYQHPHPRIQQRCWFLWLVSRGLPVGQASELAGVSRITGWRYGETYREKGIEGVLCESWEGPESGLAPHTQTLEAEFIQQPPHSVAEAAERIERLTGVRRKREQVRQFLRKTLGLSWRRTASVPCPPKKTSPSTPRSKLNS
jgi:transposase